MPSVHDLTRRLGPELVTLAVAPADPVGEFTSVVIYDPLDAPAFEPGALVLAVGVSATRSEEHTSTPVTV